MSLVTVEELIEYMSDIRLTPNQRVAAQYVIDGVQQELENYLNRPLEPVLVREAGVSDYDGIVYASVTPVHEVRSIEPLTGTPTTYETVIEPIDVDEFDRIMDRLPSTSIGPTAVAGGIYAGQIGRWFVITYVGGYKGYVDAALKLDIMRVAAREMTDNHDDVLSIKTDFAQEPNVPPVILGWTPDELKKWDRQRRRVIR